MEKAGRGQSVIRVTLDHAREHHRTRADLRVQKLADPLCFEPVKLRLVIEFDADGQRWSAAFPELPGCASAGDTEEEAVANAKEALALWFEPANVALPEGARVLELAFA